MIPDEVTLAMEAFRQAWPYVPMSKVQDGQYRRLFAGYPTEPVRSVLDDLIRIGVHNRPGPAEMGEMLRSKIGATPPGGRTQRPGLDQAAPLDECPPPESIPALVAAAKAGDIDTLRRLTPHAI